MHCFESILRFKIRALLKQGQGGDGVTVLGHKKLGFFGVLPYDILFFFRVAQMHVVGVLPIKSIEHQTSE